MIAIRALSLAGILTMSVSILLAFTTGEFFVEGSAIWSLPWGKVSLIDLYIGLFLFGAWIAYRERSAWSTAVWWIGLIVLGNLTVAVYVAVAAFSSENGEDLLLGRKRSSEK